MNLIEDIKVRLDGEQIADLPYHEVTLEGLHGGGAIMSLPLELDAGNAVAVVKLFDGIVFTPESHTLQISHPILGEITTNMFTFETSAGLIAMKLPLPKSLFEPFLP